MEKMSKSLEGKNVIVTGGARGNGAGIVCGMIEQGASVIVLDLNKGNNSDVDYRIVDLADYTSMREVFYKLCEDYRTIDVLVNNAGVSKGKVSEQYSMEDWNRTILINLTVPFQLSQLVARQMITNNNHGSIINITSLGAEFGFPENPAYCASKGGLKQLTKALAYDWAKYGIRVNNVGPGYMRTDMTIKSWNNLSLREERSKHIMLNRWGEPKDLAGICVFLASDFSEYITGQDIYVDGGWTAKGL